MGVWVRQGKGNRKEKTGWRKMVESAGQSGWILEEREREDLE